jgi:hypothetical protein
MSGGVGRLAFLVAALTALVLVTSVSSGAGGSGSIAGSHRVGTFTVNLIVVDDSGGVSKRAVRKITVTHA